MGLLAVSIFAMGLWHNVEVMPGGHDSVHHHPTTIKWAYGMALDRQYLYDTVKKWPVRYTPLTYLVGGAVLLGMRFSPNAYMVTTLLFLFMMGIALIFIGRLMMPGRVALLLPLVVMFAAPPVWEVGLSYNLEASLLAGVCVCAALFLYAEKWTTLPSLIFVCIIAGLFTLSKTVFLIPMAPFAAVLCWWPNTPRKKAQAAILMAVLITAAAWLLPRLFEVGPEIAVDYTNPHHDYQGLFYYPWLMFYGYRGGFLIVALVVLLALRFRQKEFYRFDLAFGAWFLTSFIFYSFIDTKRAWYMLAGYVAIPLWYLFSASRWWDRLWVRIVSVSLCAVYVLLTLGNAAITTTLSKPENRHGKPVAGIRRPLPLIDFEKAVMDHLVGDRKIDPRRSYAAYLTESRMSLDRVLTAIRVNSPDTVLNPRYFIADQGTMNLDIFADAVPFSTKVFSVSEDWPVIEPREFYLDHPEISITNVNERMTGYRELFDEDARFDLPGGQSMKIFINRNPEKTYIHLNDVELKAAGKDMLQYDRDFIKNDYRFTDEFNSALSSINHSDSEDRELQGNEFSKTTKDPAKSEDSRNKGATAYEKGDYQTAGALFAQLTEDDPKDHDARLWLAKSLARQGKTRQAEVHWQRLIDRIEVFGQLIQTLSALLELEANHEMPWGTTEHFLVPLLNRYKDKPELCYSLYSINVHLHQLKQDWVGTLAAISILETVLQPEQVPGVRLSKAIALHRLGKSGQAAALLIQNLSTLGPKDPVLADTTLQLALIESTMGKMEQAKSHIYQAADLGIDQGALCNAVIQIATEMISRNRADQAHTIYEWAISRLDGDAMGLIQIEQAKLAAISGDNAKARALFESALTQVLDEALKNWIHERLSEIQ